MQESWGQACCQRMEAWWPERGGTHLSKARGVTSQSDRRSLSCFLSQNTALNFLLLLFLFLLFLLLLFLLKHTQLVGPPYSWNFLSIPYKLPTQVLDSQMPSLELSPCPYFHPSCLFRLSSEIQITDLESPVTEHRRGMGSMLTPQEKLPLASPAPAFPARN